MHFYLKTPRYEIGFELTRKINVLTGTSGSGKSTLEYQIFDSSLADFRQLTLSDGVKVQRSTTFLDLREPYKDGKYFVILDETSDLKGDTELLKKIASTDNYYYLIISREDGIRIPHGLDERFRMVSVGKKHYLEKEFPIKKESPTVDFDFIITEDSTIGLQFFKYLAGDGRVDTSKSNSLMKSKLIEEVGKHKAILLLFDCSGFGTFINSLLEYIDLHKPSCGVFYVREYKCFEYLLVSSNLFKYLGESRYITEDESLKYMTEESAYEVKLMEITGVDSPLYMNHDRPPNKIPYCYVVDCCSMSEDKSALRGRCNSRLITAKVNGKDKITLMLEDTEFSDLLNLRR